MIEKLKRIHYMFYASLVFMGFPFISILLGEVPYWHFFLALLFIASYLGICEDCRKSEAVHIKGK